MRVVVVILVAALLACGGTGVSEVNTGVTTPEGEAVRGFQVKCKSDRANCLADAGDACPNGYYIVSEDQHWGGVLADAIPGPVPWWTLTIACGQAPAGFQATVRNTPQSEPAAAGSGAEPEVLAQNKKCRSDLDCGVGNKCAKDSLAFEGVCARAVDQYGLPTYESPDPGSIGPGEGQCSFDTECPVGFKCVKTSGGLRGNCMK